jgi:hypothetical protein
MRPHGASADNDHTPPAISASDRLAAALGRPPTPPPTEEEWRELQAELDRANAEAERLYGPPLDLPWLGRS